MNSCIVIQCFCKPIETMEVLKSLHNCCGLNDYNILLYIDKPDNGSSFIEKLTEKHTELVNILENYKSLNENRFKSIKILIGAWFVKFLQKYTMKLKNNSEKWG